MFKESVVSKNVNETISIAENFIKNLNDLNINIFLNGELGSGKTQFTKGIFKGLGFENFMEINSPTFEIVSTYNLPNLKINHMDLYRIEAMDLEDELWLDDTVNDNALAIIEWGNKFEIKTNKKNYFVNIFIMENDERRIEISSN